MNRTLMIVTLLTTKLYAANAPIQRIDIANMLWAGGGQVTQTAVTINFNNGGAQPCVTVTLPFQGTSTLWAGIGQPCVAAVTNIVITPISGPVSGDPIYTAPLPIAIDTHFYANQMIISQNTAPVFSSTDGTVVTSGTVKATTTSY